MAANSFALYKRDKQQEIALKYNLQNQAEIHQKALELWVNEPLKTRQQYVEMSTPKQVDQPTPQSSSQINSEIYHLNVHSASSNNPAFQIPQFESSKISPIFSSNVPLPGSVSPDVLFATQLEEPANDLQLYFNGPLEDAFKNGFDTYSNESQLNFAVGEIHRKLFYLDPSSPESKKLIYTDASIVVKSTSTPYNFELLISKSDDADNYVDEENELNDFEASFLIDVQLLFKRDRFRLQWADIEDESGICGWEFLVDSTIPGSNVDLFEEAVHYSMMQRKLKKPKDDITRNDFESFVSSYAKTVSQSSVGVWKSTSPNKSLNISPNKLVDTPVSPIIPVETAAIPKPELTLSPPDISVVQSKVRHMLKPVEIESCEVLIKMNCELWIYDVVSTTFIQCFPQIQVELLKSLEEEFKYEFVVYIEGVASIVQELKNEIYPFFDSQQLAFIWNTISEHPISWSIKFAKEDASIYQEFNHWFSNCLYEATNKSSFSKAKKLEQDFIQNMFEDMEIDSDRLIEAEEEEDEEEEETAPVKQERENPFNDNSENSLLAVGYKHNRSFVVRGNKIGVFKHGEEDDLEFATTINNIGTMNGQYFSPRKVMLHQQDSSLLMMKPKDYKNVYKMDLETGKVVEEWNVDEYLSVSEIAPEAKFSQLTAEQTILGINQKSMFKIDPRLSGSKIVQDTSKIYGSNLQFSTIATTGNGKVVVGSDKGEIRLYDKLGKIAKTSLPGLGDPIIGLDTTENGEYVLATCKTYLLLIETTVKGESKSAFEKSIKPTPRRLTLKPEHAAWLGPNISFTPAKFNAELGGREKRIITSTGKFIISWNFREIKLGKYYNYTIKEYTEKVVADNFKYGQDRDIIVALPSNVEMVKKNHLSTPVKLLKSRSEIVNSPY
ncbi:hypothetical protein HDV06_005971 [Boothiomyces sp. JEL0866]|nr:hypothetical protein HDV06_005971 [Boothiomyces sp. JEL0866]